MNAINTDDLESSGGFLSGHHSSVRGGFLSVVGYHHTSGDSAVGFSSGEIGDVDEGIVPGGEDVSDSEDDVIFRGDWWAEMDFRFGLFGLLLGHGFI